MNISTKLLFILYIFHQMLIDVMSAILLKSAPATADEKSQILVGPAIINIVSTLFAGAIKSLNTSLDMPIIADAIGIYTYWTESSKIDI